MKHLKFKLDKNGNPTPEACYYVASQFMALHEEIKDINCEYFPHNGALAVDMSNPNYAGCGTTCCHAGWWAVISDKDAKLNTRYDRRAKGYRKGREGISRTLGFVWSGSLSNWASRKSGLWGNQYGAFMFSDWGHGNKAFGQLPFTKFPLSVIAKHWIGVGDRIAEYNMMTRRCCEGD